MHRIWGEATREIAAIRFRQAIYEMNGYKECHRVHRQAATKPRKYATAGPLKPDKCSERPIDQAHLPIPETANRNNGSTRRNRESHGTLKSCESLLRKTPIFK